MLLSKQALNNIKKNNKVEIPPSANFDLPEKILQFGTGVLLRGLPDYFIDKANKKGVFNGRILVIKSTCKGNTDDFLKQDGLFTLCIRGVENQQKIEQDIINASISRVLSAKNDWHEILKSAANPDMQVIISNTTEIGITMMNDNIHASPPESFPGKLLAFLYQRFKVFHADQSKGMVVIPTELIPENGEKLLKIILDLAELNQLEADFLNWLKNCCYFCNSLVDRIVPGKLLTKQQEEMENLLGYEDKLMIMCESYRLWAIQTEHEIVKQILTFNEVDEGVVIAADIHIFRELKLRLLNGSHTFSCGLAHLAGFLTVKSAMKNKEMESYIGNLMLKEIVPVITGEQITVETATSFANKVLDRYRNPDLEHRWLDISLQYSSKMKMRNIPLLKKHFEQSRSIPQFMSLGFAAHLLFMKPVEVKDRIYWGESNGSRYVINDDNASYFHDKWNMGSPEIVVKEILTDETFWGIDLSSLPGFIDSVKRNVELLIKEGAVTAIKNLVSDKAIA